MSSKPGVAGAHKGLHAEHSDDYLEDDEDEDLDCEEPTDYQLGDQKKWKVKRPALVPELRNYNSAEEKSHET